MRNLIAAVVAVLTAAVAGAASAQTAGEYVAAAGKKLGHGALSIPYGVVDAISTPIGFAVVLDTDGRSALGFGLGVPFGLVNGGVRAGLGIWDVLTFPFVDASHERDFIWEPYVTGFNPFGPRESGQPGVAYAPRRQRAEPKPSRDL